MVSADRNEDVSSRTSTITISATKDQAQSYTLNVTQAGTEPYLTVSLSTLTLDGSGEETDFFDISSNTDWNIEVDKDWVDVSTIGGHGDGNVEVSVEENPDPQKRTANITIKTQTGNKTARVRVTQEAGVPLTVSPSSLTLDGEAGKTGTFTITTSKNWSISGKPDWIQLSGMGGTGNTTITVTTLEDNRSENDRTATITITSGNKTADLKIIQSGIYPSDVYVRIKEDYGLSNGYYFNLEFGPGAQGYAYLLYRGTAYDSFMTEESAYEEVVNQEDSYIYTVNPSEPSWTYWYNMTASTEYVLCVVAYKMKGKEKQWGKMTVKRVSTKPTATNYDVYISDITYTSSRWSWSFSKYQRCHHFYSLTASNYYAEYYSTIPDIGLAMYIKDLINEDSSYDYILNDGGYYQSRTSSDYAFMVWAWGVSDSGEFSNNISRQYKNLSSSSSKKALEKKMPNGTPMEWKLSKKERNEMRKHLHVVYK